MKHKYYKAVRFSPDLLSTLKIMELEIKNEIIQM